MKKIRFLIYMVVAINLVFVGFWLSQFSGKATYRVEKAKIIKVIDCLLYTSPSPRDGLLSRMPSSA